MAAQQPAMAPDAELYRAESRASAAAARNSNLDMERSISNANHDRTLANSLGRNKHNSQDNNNSNDGTGSGIANNESAETLDEVDIERLGRMRPACFQSWYAEIGFVSVVVTSMMMSEYFISGFNIILPYVARSLDIPDSSRTWPAAAINLSTAALLLPFARMCDLYGGRTVFLAGHAWACIWTIVSGFSQNPVMLIVCRAMQGVGVGAFVPAGLALLGQTYRPGPRKNMVFAVWGALACLGFYFGIFMGAICVEFLTWSWFFYIGAILLVVIVIAGWFSIPKNLHDIDPTIKMDWLGVITIIPGLSLVVFAFTDGGHAPDGWKTPYIYVTLILGVLFLIAGVYTQGWVAKQPLLPPELFKPKYMKRLCVVLFCCYGCYGLFLFYASFYLETVLHTSPLQTAAWFTPLAVGGIILALCGGFVMHLIPNRVLMVISCAGFFISMLLFPLIPEQSGDSKMSTNKLYWAYIFPSMLCGTIGVDITYNVTNVFITTAMPHRLQASASGLINSLLYLALAFWLGVSELAVSATIQTQGKDALGLRGQYQIGFWLGVGLSGIALLTTVTIRMGQASSAMTADEKAALDRESETDGREKQ